MSINTGSVSVCVCEHVCKLHCVFHFTEGILYNMCVLYVLFSIHDAGH